MKNKRTTSSSLVFSLQSFTRSTLTPRRGVPVDHFSRRCTSVHQTWFRSTSVDHSLNPRSVSSVKSGAGASEQPISGELLNADSMALQPTLDDTLININTEIDLFRSMMNKTWREAVTIVIYEHFECYTFQIQRQFFWELCIDVSVLFKRYGWGKGFVRPLDGGCEDFGSGDRVLFPEAKSTHCVIALPKAGTQAFDFWEEKTIEWGREDEFQFENLCAASSCRRDGKTETSFDEALCREFVSCEINGKICIFKREDCDFFLKQEEHLDRSTLTPDPPCGNPTLRVGSGVSRGVPVDQISSPYTSYKPSSNVSTLTPDPPCGNPTLRVGSGVSRGVPSVDHSSNPRSVSSVKSGTGASEQPTSNPRTPPTNPPYGGVRGLEGGVPELFNADSIRLQPSSPLPPEGGLPLDHFDKSSTFHLININTQIDYFRSMMNKTSRAAEILNEKAPEYHSYELHRQFLWELCLDVCPLFERHGWGKAFVCPLNGGYKGFASGGRVLFPEAKSTHRVIALPKSGRQVFDVRSKQRIEWGREDNFQFENLCAYREDGILSIGEVSPRDILVCQINQQAYLLKREDCDLFLLQEDCNLLLKPSKEDRRLLLHQQITNYLRKSRNEFLQESQERRKLLGKREEDMPSDGWWEHIPEDDNTRDCLTGLYDTPPIQSQVVICKDHPSVEAWMREEGVFGVVLSVDPPSIITLHDDQGNPILGKDGKEVRMPGIPRVEVTFSEDDSRGGIYLPADCVKLCEDDEDAEDYGNESKTH